MIAPLSRSAAVTKSQQLQFENQGFLYLPQLMSPALTKRLKAAYQVAQDQHITPTRGSQNKSYYDVPYLLDCDPVFTELAILPDLLPYLLTTVGDDVQLIQTCARLFPPGKTFTAPWHSDMANTLGINLGTSPNFYAKVHFYFEDLKPNQGCLAFLPGSHRMPRETERPHPGDIDPDTDSTIIVPKAGDAVLFNTHCLHMCLDNRTEADRRTLIYSYSHFWVKQFPDAQPSDMSLVPARPLERQIFGQGVDGVTIWDQRPWVEPKPSKLTLLRQKIVQKIDRPRW